MNANGLAETQSRTITLLLFSAGGIYFGAPAEQISKTVKTTVQNVDTLRNLPWEISPEKDEQVSLIVHTSDDEEFRVSIDDIEEIAAVGLNEISPFPAFIEPFLLSKGIWGVLSRNGRLFFMVNFDRISINNLIASQ
ncbi:hypothetical protein [Desulforegula conservatrix]|uniref:hypothetical protein n=1 Tax=Desulforegula conservatrix TaxID=153026 RepID=UPI00040CB88B|nr:hypothetical protein [Desulforegula conservatrix]